MFDVHEKKIVFTWKIDLKKNNLCLETKYSY